MGRFRRVKQGLITSRSEDVLSNGTERKDVGQRPAAGPSSVDRRFVSRESRVGHVPPAGMVHLGCPAVASLRASSFFPT